MRTSFVPLQIAGSAWMRRGGRAEGHTGSTATMFICFASKKRNVLYPGEDHPGCTTAGSTQSQTPAINREPSLETVRSCVWQLL